MGRKKYTGQTILRDYTNLKSDIISANMDPDWARTGTLQQRMDTIHQASQQRIRQAQAQNQSSIAGSISADIGLNMTPDVDTQMKRDVVVAVLHEQRRRFSPIPISYQISFYNMAECNSDGSIPLNPTQDKDGNGYPGDCMGWNFVDPSPTGATYVGNNRPDDDYGHGTHVAGIIAAVRNNGIGIGGISNRIKILAVRITSVDESPQSHTALTLSDRIAKGVLYAAKMKADVINLSLGWPNSAPRTRAVLRQAFQAALNAGVTIVAAAGNNTTNSPVYPCAYEGVICVGATSVDGRLAPFSNYGSHVDVDALRRRDFTAYPILIPSLPYPPSTYFSATHAMRS